MKNWYRGNIPHFFSFSVRKESQERPRVEELPSASAQKSPFSEKRSVMGKTLLLKMRTQMMVLEVEMAWNPPP